MHRFGARYGVETMLRHQQSARERRFRAGSPQVSYFDLVSRAFGRRSGAKALN